MLTITPRIETVKEKRLIGKRAKMSFAYDTTFQLWKSFMPRRKEIRHKDGKELYSVKVYDRFYFYDFNPNTVFDKWAAVEVEVYNGVPKNMERFILTGGEYAVFEYKGLDTDHTIFEYIFNEWLPNSEYILDDRPHFEILGAKYNTNSPDSEEEICIPVKKKEY